MTQPLNTCSLDHEYEGSLIAAFGITYVPFELWIVGREVKAEHKGPPDV